MAVWTEKGGRGWQRRGQCRDGEGRPGCFSSTMPLPRAECELWPPRVSHSCTWATLMPYHHLFTLLCLHHAVSKPPSIYHLCPLCSCPRVHGRHSGNVCCGKVSMIAVSRSVYRPTKLLLPCQLFDVRSLCFHLMTLHKYTANVYVCVCLYVYGCVCFYPNLNILEEIWWRVFSLSHWFEVFWPTCYKDFIHCHAHRKVLKNCPLHKQHGTNNYNLKRERHTVLSCHQIMFPFAFQFIYMVFLVSSLYHRVDKICVLFHWLLYHYSPCR